jgi:hypothetical protein
VSSIGRGGNPHAGGGGGGKKGGCLSALIIFSLGAGSLTYGLVNIL